MKKVSFSTHISWQKIPNTNFAVVYNILTHKYYELQNTDLYIWELIGERGNVDIDEIIKEVSIYYQIDFNEIKEDILKFVNSLIEVGVLTIYEYN